VAGGIWSMTFSQNIGFSSRRYIWHNTNDNKQKLKNVLFSHCIWLRVMVFNATFNNIWA
jgi:hypothetical protein